MIFSYLCTEKNNGIHCYDTLEKNNMGDGSSRVAGVRVQRQGGADATASQAFKLRLPHLLTTLRIDCRTSYKLHRLTTTDMDEENIRILHRYLPEAAIAPFLDYWRRNHLALHVSRERRSKLGDYRLPTREHPQHAISVNGNLNRCFFLWVLLHEMAHLDTFVQYGHGVKPHGEEWQCAYARLMKEYAACFPGELQALIVRCGSSVPLRRSLMRQVEARLSACGPAGDSCATLDSQPAGTMFRLRGNPGRRFRSVERRRTRWKCVDMDSGRMYLISGTAQIEPAEA